MAAPVFFARLGSPGRALDVPAALASWDRVGSPGQRRSAAFVDGVHSVVSADLSALAGPLAVRLDIGLPDGLRLFDAYDLDNYLFPLVPELSRRTGRQFAAVWATKRYAAGSTVCVGPAVACADPGGAYAFEVTTTASASTAAFKEQVRDQACAARPLPGEGVALQLAFVVGARRAWPNLWKPTIDALGPILGRDEGAREWNVRDGRITELGLHRTVDPAAGDTVTIAVRATPSHPGDRGVAVTEVSR